MGSDIFIKLKEAIDLMPDLHEKGASFKMVLSRFSEPYLPVLEQIDLVVDSVGVATFQATKVLMPFLSVD